MTTTCDHCGDVLELGGADVVRARESTGFGPANERWSSYCSRRCRAVDHGRDPVFETTRQATLAAFGPDADPADARAVAWSV